MHRIADARVLLADKRPHAALREARGHEESTWATAHDEDIRRPIHECEHYKRTIKGRGGCAFPTRRSR